MEARQESVRPGFSYQPADSGLDFVVPMLASEKLMTELEHPSPN